MGQSSAEMACLLWTPCRCLNYLKCALTACTAVQWIGLWSGCYGPHPGNDHASQHDPCHIEHPMQQKAWLNNGDRCKGNVSLREVGSGEDKFSKTFKLPLQETVYSISRVYTC